MTRHYARARKEKRAIDSTPVNTPANTTILSSVRITGETAYTIYQGGTTAERFAEYLSSTLLPTLSETDIIVMDNMRSHHAKIVKELLDKAGIRYLYLPPYSPDLNPEGFSEYYSKNLARETRKGLREAALEARYTGGNVLYSYYVGEDQKYHINEEEAVVVRKIFDCCESQCGYGGLLEELRNKGIHTRQGRVFTASTFYYILKNRRYTGDYVYSPVGNLKEHRSQPIIVENAIPAIVSKPQWEKVQAILHKRQTKGMVTAREPYLLSGLLFCGECGSPMSGHRSRKKKNGGEYVYYSYECQAKVRKHACKKRCVPRDEIEIKILDYVKMLFSQQSVAYIQNYIQTHANELNLDILTQQEQLRKSAEKLDRKIDNTIELLIDSPSDRLREKLDELEAQRRKIDYQIDELNTHKIDSDMLKDYIVEVRSLENMSRLELQQIIRKIIKKVTIYEDGHYDDFSVFYTENGGATQNRTGDQGVAVHCLTTWLCRHIK